MTESIKRLYWRYNFTKSDKFYLLDGARVVYDEGEEIVFEHHLIKKNMPILELSSEHFFGLPINEIVKFSIDSEDFGLFSFLEIIFFKKAEEIARFSDRTKKSVEFVVPKYDSFSIKLRVTGSGYTHLLGITASVVSTGGLIFEDDRKLSETLAVKKIEGQGSEDTLLVTFSKGLYYLTAEFFSHSKPQCHFASLDGKFNADQVIDFLLLQPYHKVKVYGATADILLKLSDYVTITTIE
ncbi:MAG: hypothetical protein ACK5LM_02745 [Lactovum sp.]